MTNNKELESLISLSIGNISKDLQTLYHNLDGDSFLKVIELFERQSVQFPDKSVIDQCVKDSCAYYEHEILRKSWEEIRKKNPSVNPQRTRRYKEMIIKLMNKSMED